MVVSTLQAEEFLAHRRLAVVGASDASGNFGGSIYEELRTHGYDPIAVNPGATMVKGDPCYPDLAAVPGVIDGAIVMVGRDRAVDIVRQCSARGVPRVWLFRGIGGTGGCRTTLSSWPTNLGLEVVAGACPLMFLEPVDWIHRVHRAVRRMKHDLSSATS